MPSIPMWPSRSSSLWACSSPTTSRVQGPMVLLLFPLELISQVLRLLSLTIRLWANLLAGHLLIDFMAGGLAVLLGLQVLGFFTLPLGIALFLFEAVLIAGL